MASEARIERPSGEAVLEEETADEEEEENGEGLKHEAEIIAEKVAREMHGQEIVTTVDFLARGGYNNVWLVTCNEVCQEPF